MERDRIKQWVVMKSKVNNPYGKYFSAAVTLGMDIYGEGDTIEKAYNDLTDQIFNSPYKTEILANSTSFKALNPDF